MIVVGIPVTMTRMNDTTIERAPAKTPAGRLPALTGLRFFAVLLVALHHFWTPLEAGPLPGWLVAGMNALAAHGFIGVSLFFVLSGFVLTHTYAGDDMPISRRRFWAARVARIYPMYLLGLVVAMPDLWGDMAVLVQKYGASLGTAWGLLKGGMVLGLVQAWLPSGAMFWNAPAWSLSAEAFFYLLFPMIVGMGLYRGLTFRRAALGLLGLTLLVLALGLGLYGVRLTHPGIDLYAVIGMAPVFRLPEFVAGILLGRIYRHLETDRPRLRRAAALTSGAAMAGFLLLNGLVSCPNELAIALNMPLVVALVGGLAFGAGPLAAVMSCRWAILLGEASYGIYLLHVPIGHRFAEALGQPGGHLGWQAFLASLGVTIGAACVLYRVYEDPLRRRIRQALLEPPVRSRFLGSR